MVCFKPIYFRNFEFALYTKEEIHPQVLKINHFCIKKIRKKKQCKENPRQRRHVDEGSGKWHVSL